jgi:hypothetical protein
MESIIVATVTGVLAVLGAYMGNVTISKKKSREDAIRDAERESRQAVIMERLEKKVDEHNGYAKKFEDIGKDIAIIKTELEFLRKEHEK